jgi:hypothetical protein
MSDPVVNQVRRQVILSNGQARFEVTTTVTSPGDLPFKHLFVVTIQDVLDPKADTLARIATPRDLITNADLLYIKVDSTDVRNISGDLFARVANINDITELYRDRTTAIQNGASEYLTTTVTVLYDNLTTANAAYRTVLDRLSQLVINYRTYRDTFTTNPSRNYSLPQIAISVESEYIAAYKEKKTATKDAKDAYDAAVLAKQNCEVGCKGDKEILDFLIADIAFLELAKQVVNSLIETGTLVGGTYTVAPTISFNNVVKTFCLNGGDDRSFETLLIRKKALYAIQRVKVENCDINCRNLQDNVIAANQTLINAQREEDLALGRLLTVCPSFDPTSV